MSNIFELREQLEALKKQRSSGVAKISYAGKSIEYRTMYDIDKAISRIEKEIALETGFKKSKQLKTYSSKGL